MNSSWRHRPKGSRCVPSKGDLERLDTLPGAANFDLVCAHGLLMYLSDAEAALHRLVHRTTPGGRLSFTVRNADALAYRPGVRGDFASALAAFNTHGYRNDLGAAAQAHTREQVEHWCSRADLTIDAWYGVRVLTDHRPSSAQPDDVDLPNCLAAEVEAGRRDPYRHFGSMLHFIAARR
jgi:S-adenosylmethionine-dependent methyltransferase